MLRFTHHTLLGVIIVALIFITSCQGCCQHDEPTPEDEWLNDDGGSVEDEPIADDGWVHDDGWGYEDDWRHDDDWEWWAPEDDGDYNDETPIDLDFHDGTASDNDALAAYEENPFILTVDEPESTFGVYVGTWGYPLARRFLTYNQYMPPSETVRIEELINYFDYDYPLPEAGAEYPFSVTVEMGPCPWYSPHDLLMIGIKGFDIPPVDKPPSNLVFLIDGSGSMLPAARLPLLKTSMMKLVDNLTATDRIAIIRFNDQPIQILQPTLVTTSNKTIIKSAINSLTANGSSDGGAAIQMAYQWAAENKNADGNNRVILATDGPLFNMGSAMTEAQLKDLIVSNRETFIYLTVIGLGEPADLSSSNLRTMAENGKGGFYYIDNEKEFDRVLNERATNTIFDIAKDAMAKIDFNPAKVLQYRLIGYDAPNPEDSSQPQYEPGNLMAGYALTAFYQIEFVEGERPVPPVSLSEGIAELRLRYKGPTETESSMISMPVTTDLYPVESSENFVFASAVTEWGLLLRGSEYKFDASYDNAKVRAEGTIGVDVWGLRTEFVTLVERSKELDQ